ncbi:hypothetical protein [Flavobacterium sp.]|uniref:hypothetical protein n=1 Tax=Flavobacterium sp. TaxID=239 RepID=UPI00261D079F|nr:hypothetical protein [Flavobacterium sp.]MDG2433606.1 hypothetical protein [Flavobacterium sp.]
MEPNKFDYSIKKKMEARSITPSADAWGKLDSMLAAAEISKSKKKRRSWVFIAAGLIGFLLLTTVFNLNFDNNLIQKGAPVVVDQNTIVLPEKEEIVKKEGIAAEKEETQNSKLMQVAVAKVKPKKATNSKDDQVLVEAVSTMVKEKESLASVPVIKDIATVTSNKYISATELLATVTNKKLDKSGAEKTTNFPKQSYTVNPNSLLSSAETELNQTFRETALIKLSKNFNSIKTVLVNRNYEE